MDEQVLRVRDLLGVVRRYLALFLALGLGGLAVGLAYALLRPPMPAASSIVLLPPSSTTASGQPTLDVATEIEIAESEPVLDVAARNAGLILSYSVLQHRVAVTALTPDALQITARAPTARFAESLANAVAASFIQYSTSAAVQSNQSLLALEQQYVQLGRELTTIQQQVSSTSTLLASETPGSTAAKDTQQLLTSLQVSEDNVSLEREVVSSQISQAKLSSPSAATGLVVLQRATTTLPRSVERIPLLGVLGALCGLLIAAIAAFSLERRDKRLRRRDDIAAAAEAPVLQSLTTHCPKTVEDWVTFLDSWQPSVIERSCLRKVMEDLDIASRRQSDQASFITPRRTARTRRDQLRQRLAPFDLTVIALAGDRHGLPVAPELAVCATTLGLSVALVVASEHKSTAALRTACAARDRAQDTSGRDLRTSDRPGPETAQSNLTVTLVVLEPESVDLYDWRPPQPAELGRPRATILVVSSGFAMREEIGIVTRSAARNLHPISGIVLANPDPTDKTIGQFPRATESGRRRIPSLRNVAP